jgi:hypothetical protein
MRLSHLASAAAIALAACSAPTAQWEKPGASIVTLQEDLQQCQAEARISPQALGSPTPRESLGTPAMDRVEDRDAREAQQVQKCMQAKGYSAMRR